jgi:hypothetical protein
MMRLQHLLDSEKAELLALLDELEARKRVSMCQNDFLAFIAALDANYKFGTHLKRLGALLMDVEQGHKDRVAVSMAPRMGKSQMISIYYPAWYLGRHPNHKVIVASHTAELAVDMARKVRNLMQTAEYRQIFPDTTIAADAKAAGKWNTSQGGEYFAIGTGGALAGRGAHLCLAGNTIVRVDDEGEIRLKDVQAGQKIFTVFGWQRITNKILTIHDSWVKINNVDASRDHPFLTTKGWVSAGELRIGDKIKTLTVWNRLWITASSLLRRLRERLGRA